MKKVLLAVVTVVVLAVRGVVLPRYAADQAANAARRAARGRRGAAA